MATNIETAISERELGSDKTAVSNQPVLISDSHRASEDLDEMAKKAQKHHKKWNRRMKVFFCCLGYKKNKESIADVASVFAEFFSDLNVPSSDMAAGFVLLSKYQAAQREWILKHDKNRLGIDQYLSNIPVRVDTKFLDISTADDSHLVNDLIYYMNYSLAIFGWPLQMVDDPCKICCIFPYLRLSPCCSSKRKKKRTKTTGQISSNKEEHQAKVKLDKSDQRDEASSAPADEVGASASVINDNDQSKVRGDRHEEVPGQLNDDCNMPVILEDNCCSCNAASVEVRLAEHNYEIIYISYKSSVHVVPFLVAADHAKQAIVVAIRGSMNMSDMVTDMNGTIDKLPIEDCPDDWLCHRGITRAASYVKDTLLQENILNRAFNCRPDLGSQDYQLLFCGHSLGAGAAAILGILMRKLYPNLKAYLYSPPGGILSMPAVEYTKQFAYGVILGNDTVARLGIAQLERLRYHILLSLDSTHKSSGRILARALCPSMCFGKNKVDYDPEYSLDLLNGVGGCALDHNGTKIPFQSQQHVLYVPGRLIHVIKNYSFKSKTRRLWNGPIYQAIWTDNATYDRVLIDDGMFLDHLPQNLMHSMKMLFSNTLPGRKDSRQSAGSTTLPVIASPHGHDETYLESRSGRPTSLIVADDSHEGPEMITSLKLAQAKSGIDDDDTNNNNFDDDDNNNNQPDVKLYPNLNRNPNLSSDIKRDSPNESQTSVEEVNRNKNKDIAFLDENGNEKD